MSGQQRRRAERKRPTVPLQVIDVMTDEPIGRVGDLSAEGMLLISERPIRDDALYQFCFHLPDANGTLHPIEVGVHQAWSGKSNTDGRWWIGFRIIDIGSDEHRRLVKWVAAPQAASFR